jgi:hypothetical protein
MTNGGDIFARALKSSREPFFNNYRIMSRYVHNNPFFRWNSKLEKYLLHDASQIKMNATQCGAMINM